MMIIITIVFVVSCAWAFILGREYEMTKHPEYYERLARQRWYKVQ